MLFDAAPEYGMSIEQRKEKHRSIIIIYYYYKTWTCRFGKSSTMRNSVCLSVCYVTTNEKLYHHAWYVVCHIRPIHSITYFFFITFLILFICTVLILVLCSRNRKWLYDIFVNFFFLGPYAKSTLCSFALSNSIQFVDQVCCGTSTEKTLEWPIFRNIYILFLSMMIKEL